MPSVVKDTANAAGKDRSKEESHDIRFYRPRVPYGLY